MHSAAGMQAPTAKSNPTKQYDPETEAEKVVYKNKKGELYVPSRCIKAAILNAAAWHKFGKKSAKPIIAGCTRVEPIEVILKDKGKVLKKYEIDARPVVVQRNRIIRYRPKIEDWTLSFKIVYNEEIIADTGIIKQVLEEAGQRIGLLDNRPQKYGEHGTFTVTKFVPKK